MEQKDLVDRITAIEDKLALQELTVSYLAAADRKDCKAMASYFTENGSLTSIMDEETLIFKERKGIEEGFSKILSVLTTVYHLNGQHLTSINGNNATGTCYCLVTLAGIEKNKPYVSKIWAVYQDEYVKENDKWLIKERVASVVWQEKENINYQRNN